MGYKGVSNVWSNQNPQAHFFLGGGVLGAFFMYSVASADVKYGVVGVGLGLGLAMTCLIRLRVPEVCSER